ncbi:MAG: quinone-dependent dihydroorotate dehydrogenase [Nocardioidaceae bacterium]
MTPYQRLFDAVLSRADAETAHRLGFAAIRAAGVMPGVRGRAYRRLRVHDPALEVHALGLRFPGPLGLAAGFDKNALGVDALAALGFSFVEIGTVTAHEQPGNPRPRLFRLLADRAIVNRMGFNNDGAAAVAARLARRKRRRGALPVIVGVNIGKTKAVPAAAAVTDYAASTRLLAPYADYLVVNVSSPNTPGLRDLQATERLRPLLRAVRRQADVVSRRRVPLLVKISPDLSDTDVHPIADLAVELGLDGIIACNTTTTRQRLTSPEAAVAAVGEGGLSGPPLRARSLQMLRALRERVGPEMTLVSVGGVSTAGDVRERLAAGATLVQAYTAFVFEGPWWPSRVQQCLATRDAVGTAR